MKKLFTLIIALAILAILSPLAASFYWKWQLGKTAEKISTLMPCALKAEVKDFSLGYLTSKAQISLRIKGTPYQDAIEQKIDISILNGPFIYDARGDKTLKFGRGLIALVEKGDGYLSQSQGFVHFNGRIEGSIVSDELKSMIHQLQGKQAKWGGIVGKFSTNINFDDYQYDGIISPLNLNLGFIEVNMGEGKIKVDISEDKQEQFPKGNYSVYIPELSLRDVSNNTALFALKNLKLTGNGLITNGSFNYNEQFHIENFQIHEMKTGSAKINYSTSGLDIQSLKSLLSYVLNSAFGCSNRGVKEEQLLLDFFSQGVKLNLNGHVDAGNYGKGSVRFNASIDRFNGSNIMFALTEAPNKLKMNLELRISESAFLQYALMDRTRTQDVTPSEHMQKLLGKLTRNKLLIKEGDDYVLRANYNRAQHNIYINGEMAESIFMRLQNESGQ